MFVIGSSLWQEFQQWLKSKRLEMGHTTLSARQALGWRIYEGCGNAGWLWFESDSSEVPSTQQYYQLKEMFSVPDKFDELISLQPYRGLTDIDFMKVPPEKAEHLNDEGLRSKPIKLYADLFQPTIPPTEKRKALILYGGSGNAAIAAEALGYEVTVIEQDPKRCKLIEKRSSRLVQTWREKLSQGSLWGFPTLPAPDGGDSAPSQALSTPDMFSAIEHEPTPAPRR
jgi:hypothetical protein